MHTKTEAMKRIARRKKAVVDGDGDVEGNPRHKRHQDLSPQLLSSASMTSFLSDPFHVIAVAVDHDASQRQSEEILQIPLETGKLYHNEKLFTRAVTHLQKESKIVRWGWSQPLPPSPPSSPKESRNTSSKKKSDIIALTPIILSRIIANLDDTMVTSTELVNYCVGIRRAALARVRLRKEKERVQRFVKPLLACVAVFFLYWYAWGNLKRCIVGYYGISSGNSVAEIPRLIMSSCRSKSENFGKLNDYATACRMSEAKTFELLTSTNNHRHSKILATAAEEKQNQQIRLALQKTDTQIDDTVFVDEERIKITMDLMLYDDNYDDDTELPIYAMHTLLDNESSYIPLEYVINNRYGKPVRRQRQRWLKRRKNKKPTSSPHQQMGVGNTINDDLYGILPETIQFWGDTTINRLVRDAIVEIHSNVSSSSTTTSSISSSNTKTKFRLLDVGSGLSGTLFSLCTPEFPFQDWSYHGITISQPEVRRAKQLIQTFIDPNLSLKKSSMDNNINDQDISPFFSTFTTASTENRSFPLINATIEQVSFDDPLPPKKYTTIIAIESLAYSHNLTKTLVNLASSLDTNGTLIVIEDVVAPWAGVDGNSHKKDSYRRIQRLINLTGKTSLLTHREWLSCFAATDLSLQQPPRDLLLEFDSWPVESTSSTAATAVTGLPLIGVLLGERPWYSTAHGVLLKKLEWFGFGKSDGDDDDGNISNRALSLMEDMVRNARGNAIHKHARKLADIGYYMYVYTKR